MLKPGDVGFFERASNQPSKFPGSYKFSGWGFGVVLGCVPPGMPPPPASHLFRIMGNAGFVSLDDVTELLGEQAAKVLIHNFEMKYYGRTSAQADEPGAPKPEDVAPPKLVGVDGLPLDRLTTRRLAIVDHLPGQNP